MEADTVKLEQMKVFVTMEQTARKCFLSLFPFLSWINRYNTQWFAGDLVAGITIGIVVIPQGMAYAILAGLEPQFGLYSSFMGVLVYWFFATSKDITIGPVAVVSILVGQVVESARISNPDIPAHVIASSIALVTGIIILVIGLARLGWIVDLIPLISITAFMTGSAISIASGQLPSILGIKGCNSRDSTVNILLETFKKLSESDIDALLGLSALVLLYSIRSICTKVGKDYPKLEKTLFFASTLRTVFIIWLYTLLSYLVNRSRPRNPRFAILQDVPGGLQNIAIPTIDFEIIGTFASHIPALVLVLLLEHIAIAKSFGRINDYTINASQEMVAIGVTNILGPFLGAYPATGSFSRTAIKSKSGVKTPFAGVITAAVVLVAIYALPAVFFYIPRAALSAVIIHAVLDLVASPALLSHYWQISPAEVPIFFAGLLVTMFSDVENGIYITAVASFILLIFRHLSVRPYTSSEADPLLPRRSTIFGCVFQTPSDTKTCPAQLPVPHQQCSSLSAEGIFIFEPPSSLSYLTANTILDELVANIFVSFRRTNLTHYTHPSQLPWNHIGSLEGKGPADGYEGRPILKAIVMNFEHVRVLDLTAMMRLLDIKKQLDSYAHPHPVTWHFANIQVNAISKTLLAAGFGDQQSRHIRENSDTTIIDYGSVSKAAEEFEKDEPEIQCNIKHEIEQFPRYEGASHEGSERAEEESFGSKLVVDDTHNFHMDLASAIRCAVIDVRESTETLFKSNENDSV